jgi:predicted lipase
MTTKQLAAISALVYEDGIVELPAYTTLKLECLKTDTQTYIFRSPTLQLVATRGTKITRANWTDIVTSLKVKPVDGIHQGFWEAYGSVADGINAALDPKIKVIYVGHSLGGAVSMLAHCHSTMPNKECVVFGAPRVFTKAKAKSIEAIHTNSIHRYEMTGDPVPWLPPYIMGYRHIGKEHGHNPLEFQFGSLDSKLASHAITNYIEQVR